MPTFRITCATSVYYNVDVEAPTLAAAELWYGGSDGSEFYRTDEQGWEHMSTTPLHGRVIADVVVDERGDEISKAPKEKE